MDDLIKNDDTDFLDCIDTGQLVEDFILNTKKIPLMSFIHKRDRSNALPHAVLAESSQNSISHKKMEVLAQQFGIFHLRQRGIRFLSTGEIRKAMICQALMNDPQLLILDEPYDGLDRASKKSVADAVASLNRQGIAVVLILNRFSEIPEEATHILYVRDCAVQMQGTREQISGQTNNAGQTNNDALLEIPKSGATILSCVTHSGLVPSLQVKSRPTLVRMVNVTVKYEENTVLDRLSWEVKKGEHWKISGPNGAGKSTLLSLVNGDNPQAYCNHIELFGRRRGTGESIWDIKKHTGIVSSRFQLDYRVSSNVLGVVVSGFFDSIGVYRNTSEKQKQIAMEWLAFIGMEEHARKPFKRLSYGEQRMVLIARAMVKHPALLILDEPCQGLDEINRQMVLKLIDHIGKSGESTILYVTHHEEDYLDCVTRRLQFTPESNGRMGVVIS
ncbi:MAG: molybdate ABC transporter ATP-binding protein ModF [Desulfamplus sp.]|nr:molybdate ABC transporter ATP-binding protein ModF [Desulfamplus sp.]